MWTLKWTGRTAEQEMLRKEHRTYEAGVTAFQCMKVNVNPNSLDNNNHKDNEYREYIFKIWVFRS